MYYYLVDPKEYDGKNFEYHQSRLLSLIGEYHVAGETARVTKLRTIEDLVATALSHGVTTLVVVGGDETFVRVTSIAHGKSLTIGYIPINSRSELASILGIGNLRDAVATLAKRRVETVDIARVGPTNFISSIHFGAPAVVPRLEKVGIFSSIKAWWRSQKITVELVLDDLFRVSDAVIAGSIVNARDNRWQARGGSVRVGNPKDQRLDIIFASSVSGFQAWRYRQKLAYGYYEAVPGGSVMHARKVAIVRPAGLPLYLAGQVIARAPAVVEMTTKDSLRVVVGRQRQF